MPGKERGKVILQNLLKALSPKSAAASSNDLSIFSNDTYIGNIIPDKTEHTRACKIYA